MKTAISIAFSLTIAAMVYFGTGAVEDFAYYMQMTVTVFATLAVLSGVVKGEIAERMRSKVWINTASSLVSIAAFIGAGYPGLAAYSAFLSMVIAAVAFSEADKNGADQKGAKA